MHSAEPLQGLTVLITRQEKQAKELIQKVENLGGIPYSIPLISIKSSNNMNEIACTLQKIDTYDWIIFTSANAVKHFLLHVQELDVNNFPKVAVIGEKTKETACKMGIIPTFMPKEFVAESFVLQFIELLDRASRILLPKGNLARSVIADTLNAKGHVCEELLVYENVMPESSENELAKLLRTSKIDILTFTSSSTIINFMKTIEKHNLQPTIKQSKVVCIGPVAKKTAESFGLTVHVCAETFTVDGMIETLQDYLNKEDI